MKQTGTRSLPNVPLENEILVAAVSAKRQFAIPSEFKELVSISV
jgi:hypothetical protein